ncbi:mannosyl-oligosaccharide glucosidase [Toxoplasma gondii VAND]|uniref:mannosyl-oligosaccharide glucosidase n=1 Tax=Toxoplasma gondii VAND TaxID=933077 RepID=A0A086PVZ9_TOXGO|nr:mannosyl-oligosaccharide glucosidase [Toxoplasma gondii VAND]
MRRLSLRFSARCSGVLETRSALLSRLAVSLACSLAFCLALCLALGSSWRPLTHNSSSFLLPFCAASPHPSPSSPPSSSSPSSPPSSSPFPEAFERATQWGVYRPSAFFALRSASHAGSFLSGLAWGGEGLAAPSALAAALRGDSPARSTSSSPPGLDSLERERARRASERVFHFINEQDVLDARACEKKDGASGEVADRSETPAKECRQGVQVRYREHDGIFYGRQEIQHRRPVLSSHLGGSGKGDLEDLKIKTTFVKHPEYPDKVFSFRLAASVERGEKTEAARAAVASLFVYFASEDEDFAVSVHPETRRESQTRRRLYVLGRGDDVAGDLLAVVETKRATRKERTAHGKRAKKLEEKDKENDRERDRENDGDGEGEPGELGVFFGSSFLPSAATESWDAGAHIERLLRKTPPLAQDEEALRRLPNEEAQDANFLAIQVLGSVPVQPPKERESEEDEREEDVAEEDSLVVDVHIFTGGILEKKESLDASPVQSLQRENVCGFDCLYSLSTKEIDEKIHRFLYTPPLHSPSTSPLSSPLSDHLSFLARLYSQLFRLHLSSTFPGQAPRALRSAMISNLLGGRGFFSGKLPVSPATTNKETEDDKEAEDDKETDDDKETGETAGREAKFQGKEASSWLVGDVALFSFVPSRMKFPRPFLWDEGMHALVALEWFPLLAAQNIFSWMQLLRITDQIYAGWLPREVALNREMALGLPQAFLTQFPEAGNPPTFIFALEKLVEVADDARAAPAHPLFRLLAQNRLPSRDEVTAIADIVLSMPTSGERERGEAEQMPDARAPGGQPRVREPRSERSSSLTFKLTALTDGSGSTAAALSAALARCVQAVAPLLALWVDYYVQMHTTLIPDAPNTSSFPSSSSRSSPSSPSSSSLLPSALHTLLDARRYPQWHASPASAPENSFSSGLDDFPRPLQVYENGKETKPPAAHLDLHAWMLTLLRGAERVCEFAASLPDGGTAETRETNDAPEARRSQGEDRASMCRETYEPALAALIVKLLGVDTPQSVFSTLLHDASCSQSPSASSASFSSSSSSCSGRAQRPSASSLYFHPAGILVDFATKQPLVKAKSDDEAPRLVPVPVWPWRDDGRCGKEFPISTGRPAVCNPLSESPCCSPAGFCGASPAHCSCSSCFRTPVLTNRRFWGYEGVGSAPSAYVGIPSLLPLALGLLPWRAELPFLAAARPPTPPEAEQQARKPAGGKVESRGEREEEEEGERREVDSLLLHRVVEVGENEDLGLSSAFGLRSLRRGDALYHAGSDYWRGDVWVHISALVLGGVRRFYLQKRSVQRKPRRKDSSQERELATLLQTFYDTLRKRVLVTVQREWERSGQIFERYSDLDGTGKGPFPFAGWTAMYLLLLTEK